MHTNLIRKITAGLAVSGSLFAGATALSAETIRYSTLVSSQHTGVQDAMASRSL